MGNGPLENRVKAAAARCDRIRHLPAVPPQDLADYTASSDFGLCLIEPRCLSYEYCMPNKLFEYLAAGLPVVVTDLTEIGPIVRGGAAGYVVPAYPSRTDLHLAIRSLVKSDRRQLRDNVLRLADRYTWEDQLPVLRAVYTRVFS
jgi:glycosyltransferase involved in cell wall biosynthesis